MQGKQGMKWGGVRYPTAPALTVWGVWKWGWREGVVLCCAVVCSAWQLLVGEGASVYRCCRQGKKVEKARG